VSPYSGSKNKQRHLLLTGVLLGLVLSNEDGSSDFL
jgi:hypothetical protein